MNCKKCGEKLKEIDKTKRSPIGYCVFLMGYCTLFCLQKDHPTINPSNIEKTTNK